MKKKILTVALVVALLCTCFAGTYAYLTDTHAQKNTFTTGNVLITLDEAKVKLDEETGNLVADGTDRITDGAEEQKYHLYPAMTVLKDPTITVDAESEDAWVAAKVIVSGAMLYDLIPMQGDPTESLIDINAVVKGGLLEQTTTYGDYNGLAVFQNDDYAVYQQANGNNTWTLYIFMKNAQQKNAFIELFHQLEIPSSWDNKEMALINGMNIDVEAYAAQTNGFGDCFAAMTTAFKTAFPFASANP